jgi:hypothetical protein
MEDTERQFREADAVVDKAVAVFISKIESMSGKWDAVAPSYILEGMLLTLCEELTKLIDDPDLANVMGEAMLKLSDALANFRDSRMGGSRHLREISGTKNPPGDVGGRSVMQIGRVLKRGHPSRPT